MEEILFGKALKGLITARCLHDTEYKTRVKQNTLNEMNFKSATGVI